jgi:hypothetical protein
MSRLDHLRARTDATLSELAGLSLPAGVRRPTGPSPLAHSALQTVLDHLPADRADELVANYGDRHLRACVHDLIDDTAIHALVQHPAGELPRLQRALDRLLVSRSSTWHPWEHNDAAALLADRPTPLALHYLSALSPGLPMLGLASFQRPVLLQRLADGTPPAVLLDRHLGAHLLHELARGPARGWVGGWPCWTMIEAAVTHVQRRCAPEHLFPTTLGEGLGGYRHFAMLGAYLALWRGEARTWQLATAARHPHDGLGERLGSVLALADLQAWLARGGPNLGPAWTDPFAWLKLLASAIHGGPIAHLLRDLPREDTPTVAQAQELPDLLAAAATLSWQDLPIWTRVQPPEREREVIEAAVAAMFAEDVSGPTLEAGPSDPPGGLLQLDTVACTLSAHARAHRQYTEPARWLLPPSWVSGLHHRGLRTLTLTGCSHAHRGAVLERLLDLAEGGGSLPEQLHLEVEPAPRVPTPPVDSQLRHITPVLVLGGALAHAWGERLHRARLSVTAGPFGVVADPLSCARALRWVCEAEPLPHDVVVRDRQAWRGRWHDPTLRFTDRDEACTALDALLERARATLRNQPTLLMSWESAWVVPDETGDVRPHRPGHGAARLLSVEEIVSTTREALDALTQHLARPRVLLAIHPGGEHGRTATEALHSKATLALAARELAVHPALRIFPSQELLTDPAADPRGVLRDGTLSPAGTEHLFDRFLNAWVAPDSRAWIQAWEEVLAARAEGRPDDPTRTASLAGHPFLPQPEAATAAPEPEPAEPTTAPFDEPAWRARFEQALEPGTYIAYHDHVAWIRALLHLLDELPDPPVALRLRLDVLTSLAAKVDELEQPDVLAAPYARLLHALLPHKGWEPEELAPLLRFGLRRQWLDHLDDVLSTLDELRREQLGLALLDGREGPRKGQPLRTPFDRCAVLLVGWRE